MVFKGLLVVASGFIFIFSSGIPMRMISRYRPDYRRESLYWGIGIWILAFFISTFLQNLVRQIISGGQPPTATPGLFTYLLGTVFTTLLLQIGMLIFLRKRAKKGGEVRTDGLALGFGIGLIAQIFTGMTLIGAGAGLVFQSAGLQMPAGSVQADTVGIIANASTFSLISALLSMILFRVALLTISSVQGYLVADSLSGTPKSFWLALFVSIGFTWGIFFLQLALGEENPGQILGNTAPLISILSSVYYLAAFYLGYRWLSRQLESSRPSKKK